MNSDCTDQIRKFLKNRIVLGTAQIGMNYGIANQTGKPDSKEALNIIRTAVKAGVVNFDTATAYGDSEEILGKAFSSLGVSSQVRIMSKFGDEAFTSPAECIRTAELSLDRLQSEKLALTLAHSVQSLDNPATMECFTGLKSAGLTEECGVSVYSAQDALNALNKAEVDTVQMPLNAFDHQAVVHGVIQAAVDSGKRLVFRSAFLQGLLLMPLNSLPPRMEQARKFLETWHKLCEEVEVPPRVMALQCAISMAQGMPILIGCESAKQLQENIDALDYRASHVDDVVAAMAKVAEGIPESVRNPSLWPQN